MRPDDKPEKVARTFCEEYGFSLNLVKPLADQISLNMERYFQPQQEDPKVALKMKRQNVSASTQLQSLTKAETTSNHLLQEVTKQDSYSPLVGGSTSWRTSPHKHNDTNMLGIPPLADGPDVTDTQN